LAGFWRQPGRGTNQQQNGRNHQLANFTLKDLLEAGVHFGHQAPRWNPKMKKFIFDERNGIHIIDLQKTVKCLNNAIDTVGKMSENGEEFLFVGTKKQSVDVIKEEAQRCSMHYVADRWLGGMLTNFSTIQKSIKRLKELDKMSANNYQGYTKKEALNMERERAKMEKVLSGVKELRRMPGAVIVVDCKKERLAIAEANRLEIPVIAMVDTNVDPDPVNYPIPANDDALRSIKLIINLLSESIIEGRAKFQKEMETAAKEGQTAGATGEDAKPRRHLSDRGARRSDSKDDQRGGAYSDPRRSASGSRGGGHVQQGRHSAVKPVEKKEQKG
jgi:small subunit ribosomal protein S2